MVGDEARMIEGDRARQDRDRVRSIPLQENRHDLVIFDGIDRACVSVAHAEQKAAVAADRRTEFAEQRRPKRGYESGLIDAIDQTFWIN